jgi:hypothetical protein
MGCSDSRTIGGPINRGSIENKAPVIEQPRNGTSIEEKKKSFISLDNKIIESVNFNVTKIKKTYLCKVY